MQDQKSKPCRVRSELRFQKKSIQTISQGRFRIRHLFHIIWVEERDTWRIQINFNRDEGKYDSLKR
jgi:hypothetical protein